MEYVGDLYGTIGGRKYFKTGKTAKDWDDMDKALTMVCEERDKYYEEVEKLEAENAELKDQQRDCPRVCHWSEDDDGIWNGSCGIAWIYEYATTPKENNMNYCPKCGAVLMIKESK